jgi:hypothetical protein
VRLVALEKQDKLLPLDAALLDATRAELLAEANAHGPLLIPAEPGLSIAVHPYTPRWS